MAFKAIGLRTLAIHSRTVLCQNNTRKANTIQNCHPIICLSRMWKLLTKVTAEDMYDCLEQEKLFRGEKKGYRRGSLGTIPHCWINECMKLFGIADNVNFFRKEYETMEVITDV